MAKIISIHSFRGGTGKSTITSNIASFLAQHGNRVLVIDTDINSPGVHALFGLHEESFDYTLNDYLLGECAITDIVYDVTEVAKIKRGEFLLAPSSIAYGDIANTLISKYSHDLMKEAFEALIEAYDVDYLIVDTHPGINEEMLIAAELSDILLDIIRPDNQDYQGAKVTADIMKKLQVKTGIILNKVHKGINQKKLTTTLEKSFGIPVIGIVPFSEDVMASESQYIFSTEHPRHSFTKAIQKIVSETSLRIRGSK